MAQIQATSHEGWTYEFIWLHHIGHLSLCSPMEIIYATASHHHAVGFAPLLLLIFPFGTGREDEVAVPMRRLVKEEMWREKKRVKKIRRRLWWQEKWIILPCNFRKSKYQVYQTPLNLNPVPSSWTLLRLSCMFLIFMCKLRTGYSNLLEEIVSEIGQPCVTTVLEGLGFNPSNVNHLSAFIFLSCLKA